MTRGDAHDETGVIRTDDTAVIRSEEDLRVRTVSKEAGAVGIRKTVDHNWAHTVVPVGVEHAATERQAPLEGDTGEVEILPDGSVSIPVFEEELVIEKRLVVRERIIVRKHTVTEDRRVEAELRRERVDVEADPQVAGRVMHEERADWGSPSGQQAGSSARSFQGGAA